MVEIGEQPLGPPRRIDTFADMAVEIAIRAFRPAEWPVNVDGERLDARRLLPLTLPLRGSLTLPLRGSLALPLRGSFPLPARGEREGVRGFATTTARHLARSWKQPLTSLAKSPAR